MPNSLHSGCPGNSTRFALLLAPPSLSKSLASLWEGEGVKRDSDGSPYVLVRIN